MENIYGLNHTLGMSNINDSIAMQNRNIGIQNDNIRNSYINAVATQKKAKSDSEGDTAGLEQSQEKTEGETSVSAAELGTLGIKAVKTGKVEASSVGEAADAVTTVTENPLQNLAADGADTFKESLKSNISAAASRGQILEPGKVSGAASEITGAGAEVAEVAGAGADAVKGLSKFAKAGAVLEAGEGALAIGKDISLDIKTGKFDQIAGNNDYEKVSNVSDIAGGAAVTLLGVGTVLDASFVGLPAGLALQGLAALAGGVSGVADYLGEQKEKSEVKPPPAAPKAPTASSFAGPVAFQAGGTSGQEVKVN